MYSTVFRTITACDTVGFSKSTVQALNELLERAELFRDLIIICKTDDPGDEYLPVFFKLELLGGKRISG